MNSQKHHKASKAPNVEESQTEVATEMKSDSVENNSSNSTTKAEKTKASRNAAAADVNEVIARLEARVTELELMVEKNPVLIGLKKVQERIVELESRASEISEKSEKAWTDIRSGVMKVWDDIQAKRKGHEAESKNPIETASKTSAETAAH